MMTCLMTTPRVGSAIRITGPLWWEPPTRQILKTFGATFIDVKFRRSHAIFVKIWVWCYDSFNTILINESVYTFLKRNWFQTLYFSGTLLLIWSPVICLLLRKLCGFRSVFVSLMKDCDYGEYSWNILCGWFKCVTVTHTIANGNNKQISYSSR